GEGGVQLAKIMATALQRIDLLSGHVRYQLSQLGRLPEEMFLVVGAVICAQGLILAIDGRGEPTQQRVLFIAREQRIPIRAPQYFDDVPAGAGEQAFELLNDLTVATHRSIEALQVAVD